MTKSEQSLMCPVRFWVSSRWFQHAALCFTSSSLSLSVYLSISYSGWLSSWRAFMLMLTYVCHSGFIRAQDRQTNDKHWKYMKHKMRSACACPSVCACRLCCMTKPFHSQHLVIYLFIYFLFCEELPGILRASCFISCITLLLNNISSSQNVVSDAQPN